MRGSDAADTPRTPTARSHRPPGPASHRLPPATLFSHMRLGMRTAQGAAGCAADGRLQRTYGAHCRSLPGDAPSAHSTRPQRGSLHLALAVGDASAGGCSGGGSARCGVGYAATGAERGLLCVADGTLSNMRAAHRVGGNLPRTPCAVCARFTPASLTIAPRNRQTVTASAAVWLCVLH